MVKNRYSQWGGNQHLHGHQLALYVVLFETAGKTPIDQRLRTGEALLPQYNAIGCTFKGGHTSEIHTRLPNSRSFYPSRALEGAGSSASGQWQLAVTSIVTSRFVYRVEQCGVHVGTEIFYEFGGVASPGGQWFLYHNCTNQNCTRAKASVQALSILSWPIKLRMQHHILLGNWPFADWQTIKIKPRQFRIQREMRILPTSCVQMRQTMSGWWFGTWILWLSIYIYIGNVIIPTDELIFFRGVGSTTNQIPFPDVFDAWHQAVPFTKNSILLGIHGRSPWTGHL